jgi:hypothetical protein
MRHDVAVVIIKVLGAIPETRRRRRGAAAGPSHAALYRMRERRAKSPALTIG